MGEVEEKKSMMREQRSGENLKNSPYGKLTLSNLYNLLTSKPPLKYYFNKVKKPFSETSFPKAEWDWWL